MSQSLSRPPPLPASLTPTLPKRVRALAAPFVEQQRWLFAFLGLVAFSILVDLWHLSGWGLVADVFVLAAVWSLWNAVSKFRLAAKTGDLVALAGAMKDLQGYIKITVVVLLVSFGVLVILTAVLISMLLSGGLSAQALGALHV